MALLDRLRERIETDLSDTELQATIDEVAAEIGRRYGALGEIAVTLDGARHYLHLARRLDTGESATVVEIEPGNAGAAANRTTLAADDYRFRFDGRILERLIDGTNGRELWAPTVEVTYTPVSDTGQRDEVVIQVCQLEIQYRGLSSERAGDWQATYPDAAKKREELLRSLAPRPGLTMA